MHHSTISTIEETAQHRHSDAGTDDRDVFNLVVEYIAKQVRSEYEDIVDKNGRRKTEKLPFDPTDDSEVSFWITDGDLIRSRLKTYNPDVWLACLDGEIENRDLGVLGHVSSGSTRDDLLAETELAVRNEVAFRLTDRGVFPEDTWSRDERPGAPDTDDADTESEN